MFKFIRGDRRRSKNEPVPIEEALAEAEEEEETEEPLKTEGIETTLSIPEGWNLTEEEKYVYAFHNSQSPDLKVNQISIYGMELIENNDESIRITGLIRSTVTRTVSFSDTTIILLDENEEVIARKDFDLSKLGHLQSNSARPWDFIFNKKDFVKQLEELPTEWKLAFQLERKHRLDLEESWEKALDEKTIKQLEKIVENAAPLGKKEVNFLGFNAQHKDNGELVISLLIRNGNNRDISLQQIPIGVKDATDAEVAKGSFKLDDLVVKGNTSKPWTFIFPKSMVKQDDIDLSRWKAYLIQ